MNPVVESLTGMKAFNDQFITADLLQDNQMRINSLIQCLESGPRDDLHSEVMKHLMAALDFQRRLTDYSIDKRWVTVDSTTQWDQDLQWALKAVRMV